MNIKILEDKELDKVQGGDVGYMDQGPENVMQKFVRFIIRNGMRESVFRALITGVVFP